MGSYSGESLSAGGIGGVGGGVGGVGGGLGGGGGDTTPTPRRSSISESRLFTSFSASTFSAIHLCVSSFLCSSAVLPTSLGKPRCLCAL